MSFPPNLAASSCPVCSNPDELGQVVREIAESLRDVVNDIAHADGCCHTAVGMALLFLAADHLTVSADPTEFDVARARVAAVARSAIAQVWENRAQQRGLDG